VISLQAREAEVGNLSVISAGGRMIKDFGRRTATDNKLEITWNTNSQNGEPIRPGLYFVVFSNERSSKVVKLIKQ
jgi:hypothetical protein